MKNYNDILNKVVDNELNRQELDEVNELINTNEEFKTKIIAHKFVHNSLTEIPLKYVSDNFTELVMNKIVGKLSERYNKNYLFRGVITIFVLLLVILLYGFFYLLGHLPIVQDALTYTSSYKENIIPFVNYFTEFIRTDIFKTVTGLFSFIILVGFYFNINSHKALKEKLKEL